MTNVVSINRLPVAAEPPRSITGDFQLSPQTGIYNPGVRVVREGRRRFAVYSGEHRWGWFLRLLDAGTAATVGADTIDTIDTADTDTGANLRDESLHG